MKPGIAAGNPATAAAGAEILANGGNAADAAVAATLASCVAESIMTGLLGGGHAIYFDAASGDVVEPRLLLLDPLRRGRRARRPPGAVRRGARPLRDRCRRRSRSRASPAGVGALHERFGRLPWRDVFEPAIRLARGGVEMSAGARFVPRDAGAGHDDGRGRADLRAATNMLLQAGDTLRQPGHREGALAPRRRGRRVDVHRLARPVDALADARARRDRHRGRPARRTRPIWSEPLEIDYAGKRVLTRGGLVEAAGPAAAAARGFAGLSETERVLARPPRARVRGAETHTTNVSVVDDDGNACAFTTSLGLGSGDFLPGLDLHLNSMLGEVDLVVGDLVPGERMGSMMAPSLVLDEDGLVLADRRRRRHAAADGARRSCSRGSSTRASSRRLPSTGRASTRPIRPSTPRRASTRRRWRQLERDGPTVRRWPGLHHYFGGVSTVGRDRRRRGSAPKRRGDHGLTAARAASTSAAIASTSSASLAEGALVAQPLPQLDRESLPVEVAVEVEQVRLDAQRRAAVVRVDADRDRRPVPERGAGVDAPSAAGAAPAAGRGSPSESRAACRADRPRRRRPRPRRAVRGSAPPRAGRRRRRAGRLRRSRASHPHGARPSEPGRCASAGSRSSASAGGSIRSGSASSTENGPTSSRRSVRQWPPSAAAIARTYVPELTRRSSVATPPAYATTSSAWTCERRVGIATSTPRRASR